MRKMRGQTTLKKGKLTSRKYGGGDIRFHSFSIQAIDGKSGQFCSQAALSLESSSTLLDHEVQWTQSRKAVFEWDKM